MRIAVVGGGPGGLYFAALAKELDPRHHVEVWERNPADRTYGFGVIFSAPALDALRRADLALAGALAPDLVGWNDVTVHHRGGSATTTGLGFAAIGRRALLRHLRRRCDRLGVAMHHHRAAPPVGRLRAAADLVVAADGAHSAIRAAHLESFGTTATPCALRYAWLGAGGSFDGLSFLVAETASGPVLAHAYPYEPGRSTFLVEAGPGAPTAGGRPDLDGLAGLFAEHLDGAPLRSNGSRWHHFTVVRNATWRAGNVVLLGDAAHTVHYSIGSGTKLALEDALALAAALRGAGTVPDALATYEAARRPVVEDAQRVAQASLEWFENVGTALDAPLPALMTDLLTRGGRVSLTDLRVADGLPWAA
ncbi:hypothetical protein DPM19_23605 [Actinomadura craniellae]|uniref:FAD-binding domain-containing protein n=1 Tax=Actinomadura craniellae TaxID=2231787 RepID=A0A365H0I4_9ACTN|nr:FAD-dependent monooxygenase [Actinomadura craniellae]RAY12590.1 hypothetical protein DPM19_23605 [Actinomadura craniellae]